MSQTGSPVSDGTVAPALASAFSAWAAQPSLASALRAADACYLVIAPEDGRVLHASPAAAALVAMIGADGAAIARQITPSAKSDVAPRLVRLRLDPRRILAPTLCFVAGGVRDDGARAVLVIPAAPVPLHRARPSRTSAASETAPAASPVAAAPRPPAPKAGDRFVWRSDAGGMLTALTGVADLASLVGQEWQTLLGSGAQGDAQSMLTALSERQTFRGVPITLGIGGRAIAVELSGAPLGRGEAAFSGFGGFGVVRGLQPEAAPETVAVATGPSGAETDSAIAMLSDVPSSEAERSTRAQDPSRAGAEQADAMPPLAPAATGKAPSETALPAPAASIAAAAPDTALSSDEHAAFREIARALGARYAGDEEASGDEPARPRSTGGAVMPFPGIQAEPPQSAAADPADKHALDVFAGLPVPLIVHRGEAILAANAPVFDLTGFADLAALNAAGMARLFRGLPLDAAAGTAGRRTTIETAGGRSRPVEVMRGTCAWKGSAADCLILRALPEDESAPALVAERLAREVQAIRATGAEAALDALDAGVVTIDAGCRVVSLNRAAASLFGCDAREVVGASFVGLFDAHSALRVTEALRGATGVPRTASVSGHSVSLELSPARADGRRVAVLHRLPLAQAADGEVAARGVGPEPVQGRDDRDAFLHRIDRSVRAPAAVIVDLTDAILREPFGPLGDPRYRHCLTEIKASGERMLARVRELLDIAAVEAGTLDLDPRPIALNQVVADCVARLQQEAARGRIVLRTSFSADLTDLEADERSVSRAACLVIEHAIRRSAAGGQVIVSTGEAESAQIALRVRDMGAARSDADGVRDDRGDDLALPRALVEANGGHLRLARRADEDGTLVEILLPARRAAGA